MIPREMPFRLTVSAARLAESTEAALKIASGRLKEELRLASTLQPSSASRLDILARLTEDVGNLSIQLAREVAREVAQSRYFMDPFFQTMVPVAIGMASEISRSRIATAAQAAPGSGITPIEQAYQVINKSDELIDLVNGIGARKKALQQENAMLQSAPEWLPAAIRAMSLQPALGMPAAQAALTPATTPYTPTTMAAIQASLRTPATTPPGTRSLLGSLTPRTRAAIESAMLPSYLSFPS